MTAATVRRDFPCTPSSARDARRFVESALAGTELENLAYPATVLVSELVANAILHAGTPLSVVVIPKEDRVRVEVHDGSLQLAVRKHYSDMSGTGRGLMLVEQMAAEWGCEGTADGKVVWFELDVLSAPVFDILGAEVI